MSPNEQTPPASFRGRPVGDDPVGAEILRPRGLREPHIGIGAEIAHELLERETFTTCGMPCG